MPDTIAGSKLLQGYRDPVSERFDTLIDWLERVLPGSARDITPASSDASFRRYFRVRHGGVTRIVMDAPPDREDCGRFVTLAGALGTLGLHVPEILAADLGRGFLLLTDLGECHYLGSLDDANAQWLYGDALEALLRLQTRGDRSSALLPAYDGALLDQEMALFREWFLGRHLGLDLSAQEREVLDETFGFLRERALEQPQVWVHRDYHSRNLMHTPRANPGVLDFQDAVIGPVTYDLVSLLRDCYVSWPRQRVEVWALGYRQRLHSLGMPGVDDPGAFLGWFDLMGVQRHLKAIGIFARLNWRDGKPGYLGDIPRTLGYVLQVAERYPQLADLGALLRRVTQGGDRS